MAPTQRHLVPPPRRSDLIVRPLGNGGQYVVKDPRSGEYFNLGPEESFLLLGLDGRQTTEALRAAFARRFESEISDDDLLDFLDLARERQFIDFQSDERPPKSSDGDAQPVAAQEERAEPVAPAKQRQSILFWRKSVFDPDRFFTWLAPKISVVWTRGFLVLSAGGVLFALILVMTNSRELISYFPRAFEWQTWVLAWLTLVLATTLHEFAHGLTCKHHGGEVHEVGFLLMFFIPCFYCNVSDAWLFREKSKRLWVTLAGGYCDLMLWAAAVLAWRLTAQDSALNYIALVVMSVNGVRSFFNFNPLIKLDGYYLLSDVLEIPNLRQRAWDYFMGHVRWLLWGAPRPAPEPRGALLVTFGILAWLYLAFFLWVMIVALSSFRSSTWGFLAIVTTVVITVAMGRAIFQGFSGGEVQIMFRHRPVRVVGWTVALGAAPAVLFGLSMQERAEGSFTLLPVTRAHIAAPATGFLRELLCAEGDRVEAGALLFQLDVPDLASRIAQKRAELREARRFLSEPARTADSSYARILEELRYLELLDARTRITSPVSAVVVTPHLREKLGTYLREGDAICTLETLDQLEAEIEVDETEAAQTRVGQTVTLKARALPFQTFRGEVTRIAPAAAPGDVRSTVRVYCRIDDPSEALKPGMSGYARIAGDRRCAARVLSVRLLRFLRTEFWW